MNEFKKYRKMKDRRLLSISCILAGSLSLACILIASLVHSLSPSSPGDCRSSACYPAGSDWDGREISAGSYLVGVEIPAGEYVLFGDSFPPYFELTTGQQTVSDTISGNSIVTVTHGQTLFMEHCHAVPIQNVPELDLTGAGMFKVGVHLPAGSYMLEMDDDSPLGYGYAEILADSRRQPDADSRLIQVKKPTSVTVSDGQYLRLCRCRIVWPTGSPRE